MHTGKKTVTGRWVNKHFWWKFDLPYLFDAVAVWYVIVRKLLQRVNLIQRFYSRKL